MKPQPVHIKANVHYPNVYEIIFKIPGQYQQNNYDN